MSHIENVGANNPTGLPVVQLCRSAPRTHRTSAVCNYGQQHNVNDMQLLYIPFPWSTQARNCTIEILICLPCLHGCDTLLDQMCAEYRILQVFVDLDEIVQAAVTDVDRREWR